MGDTSLVEAHGKHSHVAMRKMTGPGTHMDPSHPGRPSIHRLDDDQCWIGGITGGYKMGYLLSTNPMIYPFCIHLIKDI